MQVQLKLSTTELAEAIQVWAKGKHDMDIEVDEERIECDGNRHDEKKVDSVSVYYEA